MHAFAGGDTDCAVVIIEAIGLFVKPIRLNKRDHDSRPNKKGYCHDCGSCKKFISEES
jgi:hypothetical protein